MTPNQTADWEQEYLIIDGFAPEGSIKAIHQDSTIAFFRDIISETREQALNQVIEEVNKLRRNTMIENQLTNHVTSLSLSKKLKALGVPQRSYFSWVPSSNGSFVRQADNSRNPDSVYSAFLASELGEMLPAFVKSFKQLSIGGGWFCQLDNNPDNFDFIDTKRKEFAADTEADARAKMLIYLLEQKIIKAEKL